ncbi:MAG: RNA-guided endonuclease InsQ/TnpB family protein [Candidatus Hodarchaeales archaeon]|jgi:putative transposase
MLRTLKVKLKVNAKQARLFENMAFACTKLHNTANYDRVQQWKQTGKISSYSKQCVALKDNKWYKLLHSQSAQAILQKLDFSYRSWYALRKKDPKARPPGFRRKESLSTISFKKVGFKVEGNQFRLSLSKSFREKTGWPEKFLWVTFTTYRDLLGKPKTLEINQINGEWYGYLVEDIKPPESVLSDNPKVLAIDQGIINLAGCITSDGDTFLFTGKGLLSIQRYFNKQIKTVQHRVQSRAKDFAWSSGLTDLYHKRRYQPDHALHALAKLLVEFCKTNGIEIIVIGKLTGIRKGKDWGKKGNQKLHAWQFGRFTQLLTYKAEAAAIKVEKVSERNTSKTCSSCGKIGNRKKRGLFLCKSKKCKQYKVPLNADLNGARNILNKYLRAASRSGEVLVGPLAAPMVKYWNYHCWSSAKWKTGQKAKQRKLSRRKSVTRASPMPRVHEAGNVLAKESSPI